MQPNGSETSLLLDRLRRGMWMNEAYPTYSQMISGVMRKPTSSPGSEGGPSPSGSPDGPTTDLFGQVVAPANRSARQAKEAVARTTGTYGRIGSVSSASVALQSSLESKLRQQLDGAGSTLFSETWRRKVTPRGRQYWVHTASALRTSGSDCGSWPTASARDIAGPIDHKARGYGMQLNDAAQLASWPTPTMIDRIRDEETMAKCAEFRKRNANQNTVPLYLGEVALLASWATPTARGHKDGSSEGTVPVNGLLGRQVWAASWMTPRARGDAGKHSDDKIWNLEDQARGAISSGSPVATERRGQLNPAFSLWLMGYPAEWVSCAPQGIPSSRK